VARSLSLSTEPITSSIQFAEYKPKPQIKMQRTGTLSLQSDLRHRVYNESTLYKIRRHSEIEKFRINQPVPTMTTKTGNSENC
jgi:hypothetical protein